MRPKGKCTPTGGERGNDKGGEGKRLNDKIGVLSDMTMQCATALSTSHL